MVMKCPSCGAENPDHADFCNLCLSTVGFECAEYTAPPERDDGFTNKYPSSFDKDAPSSPPDTFTRQPPAGPVDIGQYGVRTGEKEAPARPDENGDVPPVDIGRYGTRSGHDIHEPAPLASDYTSEARGRKRRKRKR